MKLTISALILGLILLGFGLFLWNVADSQWGSESGWITTPEEHDWAEAVGIGVTGFGSGLTVSGLVNLIAVAISSRSRGKKS